MCIKNVGVEDGWNMWSINMLLQHLAILRYINIFNNNNNNNNATV